MANLDRAGVIGRLVLGLVMIVPTALLFWLLEAPERAVVFLTSFVAALGLLQAQQKT